MSFTVNVFCRLDVASVFVLWVAELCSMQTSHVQLSVWSTLCSSVSDQLRCNLLI